MEKKEPTVEISLQVLVWLVVVGCLAFPAVAYVLGHRAALESRCEKDCAGEMYSCKDGDCICNAPDGSLYRAPGWASN